MGKFEHNWDIEPDSWHYQWYRYWVKSGGKPSPYKENVCRYIRIVIATWYCNAMVWRMKFWPLSILALIAAIVGTAFAFFPATTLFTIGVLAVICVGLVALVCLAMLCEYLDRKHKTGFRQTMKIIFYPVWLAWRAGEFVGEYLIGLMFVLLASGMLVVVVVATYQDPLKVLEAAAWLLGLCVLLVALMVACTSKRWKRQVRDTTSLLVTYAGTKKRGSRVCPYLNFKDEAHD